MQQYNVIYKFLTRNLITTPIENDDNLSQVADR